MYVDDIFGGGTVKFHDDIFRPLISRFKVSKVEMHSFKFCGLSVEQDKITKEIVISQTKYISSIEPVPCTKNLNNEQKTTLLRGIAGQLLYCALTRPDIMFDTAEIVRVDKTLDERLLLASKLIERTKNISVDIKFKRLGAMEGLHLALYTDAAHNNLANGTKSTAGVVILLANSKGECVPLYWASKCIKRVTRSTKSSEARAMELGTDMAILLSRQVLEIFTGKRSESGIPVFAYCDNNGLVLSLYSPKQIEEKSLTHLIEWLKDKLKNKEINSVKWVDTHAMLADCLTKTGAPADLLLKTLRYNQIEKSCF